MDARSSRSGFHNRDASVLQEDDKEEDWDSCIMEGYLQIRAGKMGDGKHKQKYFRMRDTMLVEYKKKSNKGKYGKGSARYPKVRFAEIARPFRVRRWQLSTRPRLKLTLWPRLNRYSERCCTA
jgi:hypothetical protein